LADDGLVVDGDEVFALSLQTCVCF